MGGGTVQLVAYGEQDLKLTGNPQMTYFKYVYRQHTNFAIESLEHTIDGTISTAESAGQVVINSHSGDLMHKAYVHIEFTAGVTMDNQGDSTKYLAFTNNTGHAYIKEVEVLIGEQLIDKHYDIWFDIWNELTDPDSREHAMVNKQAAKSSYYKGTKNTEETVEDNKVKYVTATDTLTCYVPLKFWFCRHAGLAIPLLALQHHEVKINFIFRKMEGMFNSNTTFSNPTTAPNVKLLVDYIYLDSDERRKFATEKHEYLIEQLQYSGPETLKTRHDLIFNHPVKDMIWVVRNSIGGSEGTNPAVNGASFDGTANISSSTSDFGASWNYNDYFNYTCPDRTTLMENIGAIKSYETFTYATLLFNGLERFSKRRPSYFRITQPSSFYSKTPNKHIYVYSFCLKPEEFQPSGSCNMSKIQKIQLLFNAVTSTAQLMELHVFARNYNSLCIMNGMAALRFAT